MLFTTSWDDGYRLDTRVSELLSCHGCTGTFYVCPAGQHGKDMLTEDEIRSLSQEHEVGAHSMTHPKLTRISREDARGEIVQSKAWVEKVTGTECALFCYPKGDCNAEVASLVREAGYRGARTVERLRFSSGNPYFLPTTLQIAPFPWRRSFTRWWHLVDALGPMRVHWAQLRELGVPLADCRSWLSLAKRIFLIAKNKNAPFFHLWGHSAEIDRFGMWEDLETFLAFVREQGCEHGINSRLLS